MVSIYGLLGLNNLVGIYLPIKPVTIETVSLKLKNEVLHPSAPHLYFGLAILA
jgi:hypothetical protein